MSPAMASRLALVAGLLLIMGSTSCSAVSLARAGPEHADPFGVSPLGRSGGAQAGAAARASCEDAQPRSACFNAVTWLRQEGFNKHPEWYPDYGRSSTFREVQDLLSRLGKSGCPRPCLSEQGALEASEVIELEDGGRQVPSRSHLLAVPTAGCHDAAEGEWCHKSIAWLKAKGLERHPDWYPNLSRRSSSYEIQAVLHAQGKSDCPKPCEGRPEPEQTPYAVPKEITPSEAESSGECADARPDTRCYTAVAYGLAEGLAAHPDFYPGLRATATFKQVQESPLYLQDQVRLREALPRPALVGVPAGPAP
ncbi:unnamed protein product [Prorocentrum cordatum]|uniref:Subtilisin n=1 Tax=Prorocentrum cordatum TaxID=2364126 RepID=A0ABN9WQQ1_9DINO|nr:unnamed protein product [Polarella glacialis]